MLKKILFSIAIFPLAALFGDNQTESVCPVLPPDAIPFIVDIELADFELPNGWHSGATANWEGKTVLIAGRTNGMHGFNDNPDVNNFPPSAQNLTVYVIDFTQGQVWQRDIDDTSSGLNQEQIDTLSVTSPQFFQSGRTLYITGGYGINTGTGEMETKPVLSAIDLPGAIEWVISAGKGKSLSKHLRQTIDPLVQVTGGVMYQFGPHQPVLLIFGQNFTGLYTDSTNGQYTNQVRAFFIIDNGKDLYIAETQSQPVPDSSYRRRDLNVIPVMLGGKSQPYPAYVALSGVFTETTGVWTVPVFISTEGDSFMPDPDHADTFKQAMNNYVSATAELFSADSEKMYSILFGGISYGYFQDGSIVYDSEFPFVNDVTTVEINKQKEIRQYIMENQYPVIPCPIVNSNVPLRFGAGALFVANDALPAYRNGVLVLDKFVNEPTVIGYIVGGIQSCQGNNSDEGAETAASPYIFKVTLSPR